MNLTQKKLLNIAQNAISELEFSEYEHKAILNYLQINEEEYKAIVNADENTNIMFIFYKLITQLMIMKELKLKFFIQEKKQ